MSENKALVEYSIKDAAVAEMKSKYLDMQVADKDDVNNYVICKAAHQEVKQVLTDLEKERKKHKESINKAANFVDGEARRLREEIEPIRDYLQEQRAVVEDEKKRLLEEQARIEREAEEKAKREEEDRLEKIRLEQEEKAKALQEQQDKIDGQKRENEAEALRLKNEAERQEREKVEEDARKVREEQAEKDRIEREKQHAEDLKIAEKEAAAKAIRDKEAAEEAARLAEEKKKLLAPDKEKIATFSQSLRDIDAPSVKSSEASEIMSKAWGKINAVIDYLETEAEKL